jgi:hypothetical protein
VPRYHTKAILNAQGPDAEPSYVDGRGDSCRWLRRVTGWHQAFFLIVAFVLLCLVGGDPARAEIAHGFADITVEGFDFSEQVLAHAMDPATDIVIAFVVDPPLGYMLFSCNNSSLMIAVPDTTLEDLMEAPEDLGSYGCDGQVVVDRTYVIATSDGVYAKFAVRTFTESDRIIEYYVQTDGSRNLVDPVATEVTTWGRVKSLYNTHR